MEPKYLLLVKVSKGIIVRDTPRSESQGGRAMRSVSVGTALYAYNLLNVAGVPYARLVPQNPTRPEWVRVREADSSLEYVEVIELEAPMSETAELTAAIRELAGVLRNLGRNG